MDKIIVKGARENNLKNVSIELPKNKMIVMTGLSGSGKSSLAFDTIYAEGQRRYVESLSAYARQFLGGSEKPDVDSIEGLSPAISIDQKTTSNNPRSTVGTVTEIYDYLRLLFARVGTPYCPNHNIPISSQSVEEMTNKIMEYPIGTKMIILSPVVHGEKGTHKDLLDKLRKEGYIRVRVNGEMYDLSEDITLDKNVKDKIDVVIDRIVLKEESRSRLFEAIEQSTKLSNGKVVIQILGEDKKEIVFSEQFACPHCEFSLPELEPRLFSFNAPYGACPECKGLGIKLQIDPDLVIPDKNISINEGAIKTLSDDQENMDYKKLQCVCNHYKIDMDKPFSKLTKKQKDMILYGSDEVIHFNYSTKSGNIMNSNSFYEGIINNLQRRYMETSSTWIREWLENYMIEYECDTCKGARLNDDVLQVKVGGKNIYQVTKMSIKELVNFFSKLKLSKEKQEIAKLILKEIEDRLNFLKNVGLEYLTLSRSAGTLSGGEAQRIRLATQIGSALVGVLYVLDEPSIGLHQRDNEKLIGTLRHLTDIGNTLIVVEHDEDTMREADYVVDIGPGAGVHGGQIVAQGTLDEILENPKSMTGLYLSGKKVIEIPEHTREGNGNFIEIKGAKENNLKNINAKIPLGKFVCITGVSGSGKSSLINSILYKGVASKVNRLRQRPGKHKEILGLENIDKVINIDQSPIGRTPRSNPATYTGVFDQIRDLFATTNEAKARGYKKGRFSFNVKGGRCEACKGDGIIKIEMHFLPDVYVPCEVCKGERYNRETLQVKYKDKSIADVLDMNVEEALEFFENIPSIKRKLETLMDVGLSYIKLGQPSTQLSGGEAQRIKLATELSKRPTGKTLYILDEPTTGLHMADVDKLIQVLQRLADTGNTIVVIEHNLDVIKTCDYIIDLGPEGGDKGGKIIAKGTPREVSQVEDSYTGQFLKKYFE